MAFDIFGPAKATLAGFDYSKQANVDPIQQVMDRYGVSRAQALDFLGFNVNPSLGTSGGGGGGSYVDHFWDVSPVDQFGMDFRQKEFDYGMGRDAVSDARWREEFDYGKGRDTVGDQRWSTQFEYGKTRDAADDAYRQQSLAQQMAMSAMDNAASTQRAQISASAQMAAASASADAQRYNADKDWEVGMANAKNDAERNQIQERWNKAQAEIAKMEDATKRAIAGEDIKVRQFSANTDRNRLIADMAKSPRDLFGLYFMQRGQTPDWEAIRAGQTPAPLAGGALTPGIDQPAGNLFGGFGAPGGDPSSVYAPAPAAGGGGGSGPAPAPGGDGGAVSTPDKFRKWTSDYGQTSRSGMYVPPDIGQVDVYLNQHGQAGAGGFYDMNKQMYVAPDKLSTYQMGPDSIVGAAQSPIGQMATSTSGGPSQWEQWMAPLAKPAYDNSQDVQFMADGGQTRDSMFVVGDHPSGAPTGTEEIVINPTNAPVKVVPNQQSLDWAQRFQPAPNPAQRPVDQGFKYQDLMNRNFGYGSQFKQMPQARQAIDWSGLFGRGGGWAANGFAMPPGLQKRKFTSPGQPTPYGNDQRGFAIDPRMMDRYRREKEMADRQQLLNDPRYQAAIQNRTGLNPDNYSASGKNRIYAQMTGASLDGSRQAPYVGADYNPVNGNPMSPQAVAMANRQPGAMRGFDSYLQATGQEDPNAKAARLARYGLLRRYALGTSMYDNDAEAAPARTNMWQQYSTMFNLPQRETAAPSPAPAPTPAPAERAPTAASPTQPSSGYTGMMAQTWMPTSGNQYLAGRELPSMLEGLRNQGMPIAPILADSATGRQPGMFNLASAVRERGLGMLPSLDALRRMGDSEREHVLGYYGGPGGIGDQDIVDWLGKTSAHLRGAARGRAI